MTMILLRRPPRSAHDPNRLMNALLKAQIDHLHVAERNLPLRYRSEIYANAIKTEREAGEYVRSVTEAIHRAHADAEAQRFKRASKPRRGVAIAAAAAKPSRKAGSKSKPKVKSTKSKGSRKK